MRNLYGPANKHCHNPTFHSPVAHKLRITSCKRPASNQKWWALSILWIYHVAKKVPPYVEQLRPSETSFPPRPVFTRWRIRLGSRSVWAGSTPISARVSGVSRADLAWRHRSFDSYLSRLSFSLPKVIYFNSPPSLTRNITSHNIWRLSIAYSNERWFYYHSRERGWPILTASLILYVSLEKVGRMYLLRLGVKGLTWCDFRC